jgi:amino acid permease
MTAPDFAIGPIQVLLPSISPQEVLEGPWVSGPRWSQLKDNLDILWSIPLLVSLYRVYAFGGTEVIGVTVGEAAIPELSCPRPSR